MVDEFFLYKLAGVLVICAIIGIVILTIHTGITTNENNKFCTKEYPPNNGFKKTSGSTGITAKGYIKCCRDQLDLSTHTIKQECNILPYKGEK